MSLEQVMRETEHYKRLREKKERIEKSRLETKNIQLTATASTILAGMMSSDSGPKAVALDVEKAVELSVGLARKVRAFVRGNDS